MRVFVFALFLATPVLNLSSSLLSGMGELHWMMHCQDEWQDSEEASLMPQGASGAPRWQAQARCDVIHVLGLAERTDSECLKTWALVVQRKDSEPATIRWWA